ncbi:MAG: helix-turn-helix domain-containing protein [Zetaproteobacteria bacterium]|nr:helix-turn-helix domain-containing protein [Zetaproteobacteria bacterium]
MVWTVLTRAGSLLSLVASAYHFYELKFKDIKPTRLYSTSDVAKFLGVSRKDVLRLIVNDELAAHMVGENYQILGQNLIQYMSDKFTKKGK